MSWTALGTTTLTSVGAYISLPLNGVGGTVGVRIPAFAAEQSGAYEIGIFAGPEAPGFVGASNWSIAPYARYLSFSVPAGLPDPQLGIRLISHPDLANAAIEITPEWQAPTAIQSGSASNLLEFMTATGQLAAEIQGKISQALATLADLQDVQAALEGELAAIELTPGPQGEQGIPGPQGEQGIPGPQGESAVLDETLQAIADTTGAGFIKRLANGSVSLINPSTLGEALVQAVDGGGARTQMGFTVTGSSLATAADPAAARTAIGLGTMATQDANAVAITGGSGAFTGAISTTDATASTSTTTGAIRAAGGISTQDAVYAAKNCAFLGGAQFGNKALNNLLISNDFFSHNNNASVAVAPIFNRLAGLPLAAITESGFVGGAHPGSAAFDYAFGSIAQVAAGGTGILTLDFTAMVPAGYSYGRGTFVVCPYFTWLPQSFQIEYQLSNNGSWLDFGTYSGFVQDVPLFIEIDDNFRSVTHFRFTITAQPGIQAGITSIWWFPSRPFVGDGSTAGDFPQYITGQSQGEQRVYSPSLACATWGRTKQSKITPDFIQPQTHTVAQLQAGLTGQAAGATAYCSDEFGGAVPVFFDGTNWRRMTDRAVIS